MQGERGSCAREGELRTALCYLSRQLEGEKNLLDGVGKGGEMGEI